MSAARTVSGRTSSRTLCRACRVEAYLAVPFGEVEEDFMPSPRRALPRLAALGDRILLGTDFPTIPYPCVHQLHALERLGLGRDWLRAVCHDNAAKLFDL